MTAYREADHPRGDGGRWVNADAFRGTQGQVYHEEPAIALPDDVMVVVHGLRQAGYRPMLVGGSVRDALSGQQPKDIDFEVYPMHGQRFTADDLAKAGRRFGRVDEVGKSFGVLKMQVGDSDIDMSLPRRDSKTGEGHTGFDIECDTTMTFEEATARRDFTVNAMMVDPATGEFVDPHGGMDDWNSGTLRAVSDAFDEDPLRVLRGMQFAGRFDMRLDDDTAQRCRRLRDEAHTLPVERKRVEWEKWAHKSTTPSAGLKVLASSGWDEAIPGMRGLADDPEVHAEVDRLAHDADKHGLDRRVMLSAALIRRMSDTDAEAFLDQSIEGAKVQRRAFLLGRSTPPPTGDANLRMAAHDAVTLRERAVLHDADLRDAIRLGVADQPENDIVDGYMLMERTGNPPGRWLKGALADARLAQARREFYDATSLERWLTRNH